MTPELKEKYRKNNEGKAEKKINEILSMTNSGRPSVNSSLVPEYNNSVPVKEDDFILKREPDMSDEDKERRVESCNGNRNRNNYEEICRILHGEDTEAVGTCVNNLVEECKDYTRRVNELISQDIAMLNDGKNVFNNQDTVFNYAAFENKCLKPVQIKGGNEPCKNVVIRDDVPGCTLPPGVTLPAPQCEFADKN